MVCATCIVWVGELDIDHCIGKQLDGCYRRLTCAAGKSTYISNKELFMDKSPDNYAACDLVAIVEEARMRQFLNQLLYFLGTKTWKMLKGVPSNNLHCPATRRE